MLSVKAWNVRLFGMSISDSKSFSEGLNDCFGSDKENLAGEQDLLMEQILENINTTPIGQVLRKIACLPEVRKEKVLDVRRQLNGDRYDINGRLDTVVDKVLEELTS